MALYWVLFFVATAVIADDSCPDPKALSPCTCDEEGVNCMGAKNLEEIRNAFTAKFKYGGVRSVWVQGTPITSLPTGLFGNVRSQQFYIEVNNLTSVDLNAMSGSRKTLNTLSMFGNKFTTFPFTDLGQFELLSTLNLGRNKIQSIPDNALNSKSLHAIILAQNEISHIGKNAFANLPSLGRLEMSLNRLTTLGPQSLAFNRHSSSLQINLSANQIATVDDTAFQGLDPYSIFLSQNKLRTLPKSAFGTLISNIGQKGGLLEVSGNPLSCKGCDYSWIVLNKDILFNRFVGFTCEDGRSMQELTKGNIGCSY